MKCLKKHYVGLNCDVSRQGWETDDGEEGLRRIFGLEEEEERAT
jgi:hypothetical protein